MYWTVPCLGQEPVCAAADVSYWCTFVKLCKIKLLLILRSLVADSEAALCCEMQPPGGRCETSQAGSGSGSGLTLGSHEGRQQSQSAV